VGSALALSTPGGAHWSSAAAGGAQARLRVASAISTTAAVFRSRVMLAT
jgi:hypothetical protein